MPRITRHSVEPAEPQQNFVGREAEKSEFAESVRVVLGQTHPAHGRIVPHIFLISGEGGMGKSSLLKEFQRLALARGMAEPQIVLLDLADIHLPTSDDLARALAGAIEKLFADGAASYRTCLARRRELQQNYDTARGQWQRWNAMKTEHGDHEALRRLLQRCVEVRERQRAAKGLDTSPDILIDLEDARQELDELEHFFEQYGKAPASLGDLLARSMGEEGALFDDTALGAALDEDIYALAEATPLLLLIDTYEQGDAHDDWLRKTILREISDRMLVVLAGRSQLEATYRRQFDSSLPGIIASYDLNLRRLGEQEIGQYLRHRLADVSAAQIAEAFRISQGIPLSVQALGDQLARAGTLEPYLELAQDSFDETRIVRDVVKRFLSYLEEVKAEDPERERKRRDFYRVRSLALQRPQQYPDELMIASLWGAEAGTTQHELADLARRHSFVFRGGLYRLHDLVHAFVRASLRGERRRSGDWPQHAAGLQRAVQLATGRAAHRESLISDPDQRYQDAEWCDAVLDQLNALLWLGEERTAHTLLLNRWIEARHNNREYADQLRDLVREPQLQGPVWQPLLAVLDSDAPDYNALVQYETALEPHARVVLLLLRGTNPRPAEIKTESDCALLTSQISLLEQAKQQEPGWSPLDKALAQTYSRRAYYYRFKKRDYLLAIHDYDRSLQLRPDDASTLSNRGISRGYIGDLAGALADYDHSLELRPDDASTLSNRGITKGRMGDPSGALADCGRSLELRPDHPNTLTNRGIAKRHLGDLMGSLADYDRSLELRPDHPATLHNRGNTKDDMGDLAGALADYNRSLEVRPDDPATLYNRGNTKDDMGDQAGALVDYDRSLELRPDDPATLYNRGLVKYYLDNLSGAMEDFYEALRLRPEDSDTVYCISCGHAILLEIDTSLEWLARAITLDDQYRDMARTETDFDGIREDPRFVALIGNAA